MRILRLWIDADGRAHAEEAAWAPAEPGDERGRVIAPAMPFELPDGGTVPAAPQILAALSDSPVDLDQLSVDRQALYELPIAEGARLVERDEYLEASEAERVADEAGQASVAEQLAAERAAAAEPRRAALAKLAEAAGLTEAETAALLEES